MQVFFAKKLSFFKTSRYWGIPSADSAYLGEPSRADNPRALWMLRGPVPGLSHAKCKARVWLSPVSQKQLQKQKDDLIRDRPLCWRTPIFPGRFQPSIFGTNELNFRVRDGNGWTLAVINTNLFFAVSLDGFIIIPQPAAKCKLFFNFFLDFLFIAKYRL